MPRLPIRLLGVVAVFAVTMLTGCTDQITHTKTVVEVSMSGTLDSNGDMAHRYSINFVVNTQIYKRLTGLAITCDSDCKPDRGLKTDVETIDPYLSDSQRKVVGCLMKETPTPTIVGYLNAATGDLNQRDPDSGIWYPRQPSMAAGSTVTVLTENCNTAQKTDLSDEDVVIGKG